MPRSISLVLLLLMMLMAFQSASRWNVANGIHAEGMPGNMYVFIPVGDSAASFGSWQPDHAISTLQVPASACTAC